MAIVWTDINNGETALSIRTKINTFSNDVVTETSNLTTSINNNITNTLSNSNRLDTLEGADLDNRVTTNESNILELQTGYYGGWTASPNLQLVNTYSIANSFVSDIAPVNITESNGRFTVTADGVYNLILERIYINQDTSPSQPVMLYIDLRVNGISVLTRSGIISAATAGDEPSIDSYTSPKLLPLTAGDYFEVFVKAEEGIGSPSATYLTTMNVVLYKLI